MLFQIRQVLAVDIYFFRGGDFFERASFLTS